MRAPPPEVHADNSLDSLAPKFREAVEKILEQMGDAKVSETTRTFARQSYLYGFGREYDDGRGIVTNAASNSGGNSPGRLNQSKAALAVRQFMGQLAAIKQKNES